MSPRIVEKLRSHQRSPAAHLREVLKTHRTAIDTSITGAGKTYIGVACAADISEPCLVVCPKVAIASWQRAADHFSERLSIIGWEALRVGTSPYGFWERGTPPPAAEREFFKCVICQRQGEILSQPCPHHHLGVHCVATKRKPHRYGRFIFHPAVRMVIFDEVHRACNDSLNEETVLAAKRQRLYCLALSATPGSSPLHLRALGYLLDLHKFVDFDSWCYKKGCRRVPVSGMRWQVSESEQLRIMGDIRQQLIPARGIRLTKADIPNFPDCHISAELYDLPDKDTAELDALYKEVSESHLKLEERKKLDINPESPLTKRLRARQLIELLKVPVATELGRDYREKNHSVIFFVNFRATIDELKKRFPEAGVIDGITPDRTETVDRFQCNSTRELIVNAAAGGECLSLQDLFGDFIRVGLVFPGDSAIKMRQLLGRLARDGGKSAAYYRVLFASRSVEVPMRRALAAKLNNLDALVDGDLQPSNLSY